MDGNKITAKDNKTTEEAEAAEEEVVTGIMVPETTKRERDNDQRTDAYSMTNAPNNRDNNQNNNNGQYQEIRTRNYRRRGNNRHNIKYVENQDQGNYQNPETVEQARSPEEEQTKT